MSTLKNSKNLGENELQGNGIQETQGIEAEMEQAHDQMLGRLFTALGSLEHKAVLADTTNGFDTIKLYRDFGWDVFKTNSDNPTMKISVGNDFYSDEEAEKFIFRLDDIMEVDVEDNLCEGECVNGLTDEPYWVENVVITLFSQAQLKLELQW